MINKLEITIGHKSGRSYLKDSYYTRPFRLASVGEDHSDPALYLVIMSSSPGILDKDKYDIRVTAEINSRLQLQSQSYQRLFKMKDGASQELLMVLEEDSEISYIQHPIVPHESSIFKSRNVIQLKDRSIFTYGEIVTCGRKLSGEVFKFKHFQNLTEIYYKDKILIKDNIILEPEVMNIHTMGQLENYTHQASFIHINTRSEDISERANTIYELLQKEEDILFGLSQPLPNIISVRVLGHGGEQLFEAFKRIDKYLWNFNN